jgi:probable HAF family extracellular repeat protein
MTRRIAIACGIGAAVAVTAQPQHAQEIATFSKLPSLHRGPTEAKAVNAAGTVIVGYSWGRDGLLYAVKWTLQNGVWVIGILQRPVGCMYSLAAAVNDAGDAAGHDSTPSTTRRPVLWPFSGGSTVLGCSNDPVSKLVTVYGISGGGQVAVGGSQGAVVWRPGRCAERLPPLVAGGGSAALVVNGDGTIVGGFASPSLDAPASVPVRWANITGHWQITQLDHRPGGAMGANALGDLAGRVVVPCALENGCSRAAVWYAGGGSVELGTLGGAESWARGINASDEVVGGSTAGNGVNTGFFWSEWSGMLKLPVKGQWAAANAVSDVRPDGTRLVVGMDSQGQGLVWVIRNP